MPGLSGADRALTIGDGELRGSAEARQLAPVVTLRRRSGPARPAVSDGAPGACSSWSKSSSTTGAGGEEVRASTASG